MKLPSEDMKSRLFGQPFGEGQVMFRTGAKNGYLLTLPPSDLNALAEGVAAAVLKTQAYYLDQQHKDGYWWYELESNVTITSEYLMLLRFLGLSDKDRDRKMANHILRHQRNDGAWSIHYGGEGDLSTTIEAYFALKLAGFSADDARLKKARSFILEKGGVEASRVFTKIFLALFGEFDWRAIPSIPPEINLMPHWFPINIYNLSSWARSTIVPLSAVLARKPFIQVREREKISELFKDRSKRPPIITKRLRLLTWKRFFIVLDSVIKFIEHFPLRPLREISVKYTERWILEHQEKTGDWGGIQPAMINSVLALSALGYDMSHEPFRKGIEALERFTIETDDELLLQACVSPIWDTALTALAFLYSGTEKEHPSLADACRWLASKQIFEKGDWSVKKPNLVSGGWAFEFQNDWYPDVDDTAVVLMLLNRYVGAGILSSENRDKAVAWTLGMQGKDGGWGAFDVDNNMRIFNQLPFGDLEAMIDPSSPDLTGRVLEMIGPLGYGLSDDVVLRAIAFLKKTQEEDGSWWSRWGVNYINGTWSVLMGLSSIGEDMTKPYARKAVNWLKDMQRQDGGWGECCESYGDSCLKRRGESTPSQTAWAMLALTAAGEGRCDEVVRGAQYLLSSQNADGTWNEEAFTGTGFPKYFMIRYHNYRNCFPLMALGKFQSSLTEEGLRK